MGAPLNPAFVAKVREIRAALDGLDYFQILRIGYDADAEQVRNAYRRQAHAFHPDRYHHLADAALFADLNAIAKRITEAYVVLRDAGRRTRYLQAIRGEQRAASLRFIDSADEGQQENATPGTTEQGRRLYAEALKQWQQGERQGALRSLQMALVYERDNVTFQGTLKTWSETHG